MKAGTMSFTTPDSVQSGMALRVLKVQGHHRTTFPTSTETLPSCSTTSCAT